MIIAAFKCYHWVYKMGVGGFDNRKINPTFIQEITTDNYMRKILILAMATTCALSAVAQPKLTKDNIDEVLVEGE